eukprot:TRINITY_DN15625_c0_g1_i1.p1 TRINITY_DN15625_c0_g1~~TRINITY_DN15625_c0_g1_i1.p1  ORF type:complete len:77 (-),score=7.49 TRINITY_DN15625_c0_g1_i1:112-342(-)
MTNAGFNLAGAFEHAIVPIMLGDAKLATDFSNDMLQEGIYVIGFSSLWFQRAKLGFVYKFQLDTAKNKLTRRSKRS